MCIIKRTQLSSKYNYFFPGWRRNGCTVRERGDISAPDSRRKSLNTYPQHVRLQRLLRLVTIVTVMWSMWLNVFFVSIWPKKLVRSKACVVRVSFFSLQFKNLIEKKPCKIFGSVSSTIWIFSLHIHMIKRWIGNAVSKYLLKYNIFIENVQ